MVVWLFFVGVGVMWVCRLLFGFDCLGLGLNFIVIMFGWFVCFACLWLCIGLVLGLVCLL